MKRLFQITAVLVAGLALTACDDDIFDELSAQQILDEAGKIQLRGEQVILTPDQVTCGEKKGLWVVDLMDSGDYIARLTAEGRALQFGDDIRMGDRHYSGPYTQLSGALEVHVNRIDKITDEKPNAKIVEAKVGVKIDHECFKEHPLPLLGIVRGNFSEDADPRFRLRQKSDWVVEQVLH
jgi:hypothetical protein